MNRRPESVLVVVHSRCGQALVLRRVKPEGLWQSVTGSLGWDEAPGDAAERELREETGLEGMPEATGRTRSFEILPELKDRYAPNVRFNLEHEFLLELPEPREIRLSAEHSAYRWLPLEEAVELVFSWTNRRALERLIDG